MHKEQKQQRNSSTGTKGRPKSNPAGCTFASSPINISRKNHQPIPPGQKVRSAATICPLWLVRTRATLCCPNDFAPAEKTVAATRISIQGAGFGPRGSRVGDGVFFGGGGRGGGEGRGRRWEEWMLGDFFQRERRIGFCAP